MLSALVHCESPDLFDSVAVGARSAPLRPGHPAHSCWSQERFARRRREGRQHRQSQSSDDGTSLLSSSLLSVGRRRRRRSVHTLFSEKGESLKEDVGAVLYAEVSAKTKAGLNELFDQVSALLNGRRNESTNQRQPVARSSTLS